MQYNILEKCALINSKFSESDLAPIKSEINNIQNNFELYKTQKFNKELAGNIKREYQLIESKKHIEQLLAPLVQSHDKEFDYIKNTIATLSAKKAQITLNSCWVNFQKKYEFNPLHSHSGLLSFVIWINVPYDMNEEHKLSPGVESNLNQAGMFSFVFPDTLGGVKPFLIPIDKSMENNIILFPSNFHHMVYPFFSSDGYRISVSGNLKLNLG